MERRVLSMWQPFASLLASGIKRVETRHFDTPYRGDFYIHASQNMPKKEMYIDYYLKDDNFREIVNQYLHEPLNAVLPLQSLRERFITGAIVGKATVSETFEAQALKQKWFTMNRTGWQRECSLGNLSTGRFAWMIQNAQHFDRCSPVLGKQSIFWRLPEDFILAQS